MAFRLTHEMGLHLDPNNWSQGGSDNSRTASTADREVLRRVYWAAFVLDKQLSLYFGRPPALYPNEADVRDTIRIPYPPEWEGLLDTYISKDTSVTAFEDGIALVGAFVQWVELSKIFHTMTVDVFESRRKTNNQAVMETAHQVHLAMERWMSTLPQKLHWSQWTVTCVPHYVLHLHTLFHTGMIILHRPPRKHLENTDIHQSEDVEICYGSLVAIIQLLRTFGRQHRYQSLPLSFVHTLSAAASVVLLKQYLEKLSWDNMSISKPLGVILEAIEAI
ncbi:transcription factor [Fusarium mexicanum]|uniref:Transcription factor n=1 Tax=Fusarium mexicanum TaxID=751941 RepID=A0A8H5JGV6_9HYPO|nr:transcription factor [Fusarium mexicanum]